MSRRRKDAGTVLAETILAMALVSILLVAAGGLLSVGWCLYTRTQQRTRAISRAESLLTTLCADLRRADGWLRLCETDPQDPQSVFDAPGQAEGNAAWLLTRDGSWLLLDAGALPATVTEDGVFAQADSGTVHRRSFWAATQTEPPGCLWTGPDGYLARRCTALPADDFAVTLQFWVQKQTEDGRVAALGVSVALQNQQGIGCRRETVISLPNRPRLASA